MMDVVYYTSLYRKGDAVTFMDIDTKLPRTGVVTGSPKGKLKEYPVKVKDESPVLVPESLMAFALS